MSSITLPLDEPALSPAPAPQRRTPENTWPLAARVITAICALVVLGALARVWFVHGFYRPIRVEGGSMAESLCGEHLRGICRDCGCVVRCDVASIPGDGDLLCPNCGFPSNPESEATGTRGERVLVDSFPDALGSLKRWDVVAISRFGQESGPVVKRVVALPGEAWEIREGDIWIDGRIERKSLPQLRQMWLTVNDDRFRPHSQQDASRWQATVKHTGWKASGHRFVHEAIEENVADDWLTYHHQRGLGGTPGGDRATTVKDLDAYNQAESRLLHPVNDIGAAFRVQLKKPQELHLSVLGHAGRLTCSLEIGAGRLVLASETEQLAEQSLHWHDWRQPTLVEYGICDQQFLLALNGHDVLRVGLQNEPMLPTSEPLAIRVIATSAVVSQLRVWRDLHYLDPRGLTDDWKPTRPLATDQIAVLGDNPPVSIDSRHISTPIRREDLWGHLRRPFRAP